MLQIKVDKSPIPIIWLDTSVIINMAKWKAGENIHQIEKERVAGLYQKIYDLVRLAKLICPEADQREEIELGGRLLNECWDVQASLSLEVVTHHRQAIEDNQTQKAMIVYIQGKPEIRLNYKDVFHRNPIEEIKKDKQFIISAHTILPDEWKQKWRNVKTNVANDLEKARQEVISNGLSFEKQLEMEYRGILEGILMLGDRFWSKIQKGEEITLEDFMGIQSLSLPLGWWKSYGGKPEGLPGLINFYLSDVFKEIPWVEIKCKLLAKMLTSNTKIESGDSMDINQLSAMIPYCDVIVTDRKMKTRIVELGLDQKFQTKVFFTRDFSEIMDYLDGL